MIPAVSGLTTPSIAEASSGSSKRYGPRVQVMSMSSGSRVRREGTIAMSSKPVGPAALLASPDLDFHSASLCSFADEKTPAGRGESDSIPLFAALSWTRSNAHRG